MRKIAIAILLFVCIACWPKTVTYNVIGTNRINSVGAEPIGAFVYFRGMKQLTEHTSAYLVLHGYANTNITSVVLSMHSNSTNGAGSLLMTVGRKKVWQIPNSSFNSDYWYGVFTRNFVNIEHNFDPWQMVTRGDSILIKIEATESSLYISSFTIGYRPIPTEPQTVCFSTNTDSIVPHRTETKTQGGIVLPNLHYQDSLWRFVGWSETKIMDTDEEPRLLLPDSIYYPCELCTLYAVYASVSARSQVQIVQDTVFESGDYVMGTPWFYRSLAAGGVNKDKRLYSYRIEDIRYTEDSLWIYPLTFVPSVCRYQITFFPADSTAKIYNTYNKSFVSPPFSNSNGLSNSEEFWQWQYRIHDSRYVTFYKEYTEEKTRTLCPTTGSTRNTVDSIWFELQNVRGYSKLIALSLFNVSEFEYDEEEIVIYTMAPYGYTAVENIGYKGMTATYIPNPEKLLLSVTSVQGQLMLTTTSDIDLQGYPKGMYIVSGLGKENYKVLVP